MNTYRGKHVSSAPRSVSSSSFRRGRHQIKAATISAGW